MLERVDQVVLAERIRRERPYVNERAAEMMAAELKEKTDERLEENVLEWMHGLPVSPVICTGRNGKVYTIQSILDRYRGHDFISALECMNVFYEDPDKAEILVRRIYR